MSEFGLDSKVLIDETIRGQDVGELKSFITDKNYPFVGDQQNGSYSNQLSYDLTGLVSSDSDLGLQNTYLLAPLAASLNSTVAWTGTIPPSAISIKNNFINEVDSIQVFVNNKQMVDQTTMMNLPVSVLNRLEMSVADLKLEGRGLGIAPDTYSAVSYSSTASIQGDGYLNNMLVPSSATDALSVKYQNKGALDRSCMFVNCSGVTDPSQTLPAIGASGSVATRVANARAQGVPYFTSGSTANQAAAWNFIAYIPLRRLHDLFCRMPLMNNAQVRLVINLNLGSTVINHSATTFSLSSTTMTAGNTFPLMFNGKTNAGILPTSGTTTISLNIQNTTAVPSINGAAGASYGYPLLPQTRIYAEKITLAPQFKEKLLANPVKTVRYLEWFQYPFKATAGTAYSQTISTALPNVALAVVCPFQASSSTIFASATGVAQYQSPFDAAPEQTLPLGTGAFQQMNFQINGQNVWTNNNQFTYDMFCQEVKSLSLNGSLNKELASGLMDLVDWQFSPVAICDLGDRPDAQSDAYQSVVLNGTNACAVDVDYKVFIGYWKTYSINVITGQVEKIF